MAGLRRFDHSLSGASLTGGAALFVGRRRSWVGEGREWLQQLGAGAAVREDEDVLEEDLVQQLPDVIRGVAICGRAISQQVEREVKRAFDRFHVGAVSCSLPSVLAQSRADAFLLLLEQVERDRIRVVRLQDALLFAFELLALGSELLDRTFDIGATGLEFAHDHRLDVGQEIRRESTRKFGVVVLHFHFDLVDEDRLELAAVLLPVAAVADEVGVQVALAVLRHLHDEAGAAVAASQRALEVVIVGAAALADASRREHLLNDLERLVVDDRGVSPGVGRSLEGDDARVVGLGE